MLREGRGDELKTNRVKSFRMRGWEGAVLSGFSQKEFHISNLKLFHKALTTLMLSSFHSARRFLIKNTRTFSNINNVLKCTSFFPLMPPLMIWSVQRKCLHSRRFGKLYCDKSHKNLIYCHQGIACPPTHLVVEQLQRRQ